MLVFLSLLVFYFFTWSTEVTLTLHWDIIWLKQWRSHFISMTKKRRNINRLAQTWRHLKMLVLTLDAIKLNLHGTGFEGLVCLSGISCKRGKYALIFIVYWAFCGSSTTASRRLMDMRHRLRHWSTIIQLTNSATQYNKFPKQRHIPAHCWKKKKKSTRKAK